MPNERRRKRSVRLIVASLLLAASAVFVTVAVLAASRGILIAASITAVVVGVAAARIVADEVLVTRRAWYEDRASQAQSYRDITVDRTRESMEFVEAVNETMARTTRRIVELNGTLRLAEARADESDAKRAKVEHELAEARSADEPDLSQMVLWEGAEMPTIVDMLSWEPAGRDDAADDLGAETGDAETGDDGELPEAKQA